MLNYDQATQITRLQCDEPNCAYEIVESCKDSMSDVLRLAASEGWGVEYSGKNTPTVRHYCPSHAHMRDGVTMMSGHIKSANPLKGVGSQDPSGILAGIITTAGHTVSPEEVRKEREQKKRESAMKPVAHMEEETLVEFKEKLSSAGSWLDMIGGDD